MKSTRYELKYCEGCGALKLRPVTSGEAYCARCEYMLSRYSLSRQAGGSERRLPSAAELKALVGIVPQAAGRAAGRAQ